MKKRKFQKKIAGLKKWNKIVSVLVKDYKKRGEKYDLKDVRKEASAIYKGGDFKNVSPSKLRVKDVIKKKQDVKLDEREIDASMIDKDIWFIDEDGGLKFGYYFHLGEHLTNLSNTFPQIPIMVVTQSNRNNPLVLQGFQGSYDGSPFQSLVEDLREDLSDPNDSLSQEVGEFFGEAIDINGKKYALFYDGNIDIDELRKDLKFKIKFEVEKTEPRLRKIIDKKEDDAKKKMEKPKKKRGRPKKKPSDEPKKPIKKGDKKPLKKDDKRLKGNRGEARAKEIRGLIADLNSQIKDLRKDVKDGLITKTMFRQELKRKNKQMETLTNKLEKGGKI